MMKRLIILALLMPLPAAAAPLVADLSTYRINMDSSFTGSRVFLFGARNDTGDVVAVIRGPHKNFIVRKKENIGGLWINRGRMKLFNIPAFYAVASSRPLTEIGQGNVLRSLGIGERTLLPVPADPRVLSNFSEYAAAFLKHQHAQKLYTQDLDVVRFMGEMLFKTVIEFPDKIPTGNYTAEMYLISDGKVTGMQTMPITVVKTGLDAWLYTLAHHSPAWYGLMAVMLAVAAGWLASRIFEKI